MGVVSYSGKTVHSTLKLLPVIFNSEHDSIFQSMTQVLPLTAMSILADLQLNSYVICVVINEYCNQDL